MYDSANPACFEPNDSKAMRWYAKAAAQGHERAQAHIDAIFAKRRASSAATEAAASELEQTGRKGKKGKKAGSKKRND